MGQDFTHTSKDKDKKLSSGLGIAKTLSSLVYLGYGVTKTVFSALAGDVTGVAQNIATVSMFISNASGLSYSVNKLREKINQSQFAKSNIGKALISASGAIWDIATSRPVKLALKITGLALAAASTTTPVGWALLGLSAGYVAYKITTGCMNEGKNIRLEAEENNLRNKARPISYEVLEVVKENPTLHQFIFDKLNSANYDKLKTREGFGASIVKTVISNAFETTGLIIEAFRGGNLSALMAGGTSVAGNVSDEAREIIERKEKQNKFLVKNEELKLQIVAAALLESLDLTNAIDKNKLETKFNEMYNKQFPPKTLKMRIINVFGDIGRGAGNFLTQGLPKLTSQLSAHSKEFKQNTHSSISLDNNTVKNHQISSAAKLEAEQNRKSLEADASKRPSQINSSNAFNMHASQQLHKPRAQDSNINNRTSKAKPRSLTR